MITPRFRLTQTENTVTIILRTPYCNLRNLEITVDEHVFIFLCSPYYLRLNLPGQIVENELAKTSFNSDSGEFSLTYEKIVPGEYFYDLDLITKLLCTKIDVHDVEHRKITVLTNDTEEKIRSSDELNQEFGFALAGKQKFRYVSGEFMDVFEIDPREVNLQDRRKKRLQYEQGKFNVDHYLSDFIENEEILELMGIESPWSTLKRENIEFTDNELDFLKNLSNIEYKLSEEQIRICHCCLIDILYAYCYDRRTTYFEGSSESGWTIIKLAASFGWLDGFKDPREALISGFRRSLIYPLYRNFNLNQQILIDLRQILDLGEKYIIQCLIQMHNIFLKGDCCRYIINNLFIKDYIIYLMKWDKTKFQEIVSIVNDIKINKSDLGLNLSELEDSICNNSFDLAKLKIAEADSDDDTSSASSDSESSTESSNSSSSDSSTE